MNRKAFLISFAAFLVSGAIFAGVSYRVVTTLRDGRPAAIRHGSESAIDLEYQKLPADSQSRQLAENIESLQDLHANLADEGLDPRTIPLVMQYNKRDLPVGEISSVEDLDETLNFRGVPHFSAIAVSGGGVFETLRSISILSFRP